MSTLPSPMTRADIIAAAGAEGLPASTAAPGSALAGAVENAGIIYPDPQTGFDNSPSDIFRAIAPAGAISPADGNRVVTGEPRTYQKTGASSWVDLGDVAAQLTRAALLATGKDGLGLDQVDNTSDAQKVASGPLAEALDAKVAEDVFNGTVAEIAGDLVAQQAVLVEPVTTVAELLALPSPADGVRKFLRSRLTPNYTLKNPYSGSGEFVYRSEYAGQNDGGIILNGWVRIWDGTTVQVDWFGADPTGQTDSTAAVAQAVRAITGRDTSNFITKSPTVTVQFSAGVYMVGDLPLVSGVHYRGVGQYSTQLIPAPGATWVMKTVGSVEVSPIAVADRMIYTTISDMVIGYGYRISLPMTNTVSGGVFLQANSWCRFKNVGIHGLGGTGLKCLGVFDMDFTDLSIFGVGYQQLAPALIIDRVAGSPDGSNAISFRRLHIEGCYQHFYIGQNSRHIWFDWSKFENQNVPSIIEYHQGVTFNHAEVSITTTAFPWLRMPTTTGYSPFVVEFNDSSFIGQGWYFENLTSFKLRLNDCVGRRPVKLFSGRNCIITNFFGYDCGPQLIYSTGNVKLRDSDFIACKSPTATDGSEDTIIFTGSGESCIDCEFNGQGTATDGAAFVNITASSSARVIGNTFGAGAQYGMRGAENVNHLDNAFTNVLYSVFGSRRVPLSNRNTAGLGVGSINSVNVNVPANGTATATGFLAGGSLITMRVPSRFAATLYADSALSGVNIVSALGTVPVVASGTPVDNDGKVYVNKSGANLTITNKTPEALSIYLLEVNAVG